MGLLLRNADPKLAHAGLSWGYDALVGEPPETQVSAQDSGLFHIHSSIPAGLTCWKTKVTGELRFWVLLLLIKVDTPSDIRMGGTSHTNLHVSHVQLPVPQYPGPGGLYPATFPFLVWR